MNPDLTLAVNTSSEAIVLKTIFIFLAALVGIDAVGQFLYIRSVRSVDMV